MPTINEYTQRLPDYNINPQNYDPSLEIQVAIKQQKNYDRILNTVKGLQSQALNIQMLNQEGRQRLEKYNKELNEKLSGDLGDLNKTEVQNEIAGYFQNIAGDNQLIKASQLSSEYQNQLDMIESFRQSGRKDRGYNSINETVFKEWDGGLYDFMQSDLGKVTNPGFQPTKYTPFKELDTKLLNIAKSLHADTVIREGSGSDGYLLHKEVTGVSPEKIREMMMTQFDQEDLEQLDVMSKYEVIQNRRLNTIPDFYQKYNQFADNEIKRTQSQGDVLKQQAEYYQTLINDAKTPAEKKIEYLQKVNELKTNSELYNNRANSLQASKKDLGDFEKMTNDELLKYSKEMQWFTKINGISDALSWKKDVEIYKPDQVWMFNKKMDVMKWQEELRASTKLATARMTKEKSEVPEFSGQIDAVKNTQTFFDTYKNLTGMQQQMAKISDEFVTAPSFDSKQLLNDNFLKENKDNYQIKMWDTFSRENPNLAIKNGQPQIEAFKLWLKDKEANPEGLTGQYVAEQSRNKVVSDYLDTQVMEINQATRKSMNYYDDLVGNGYNLYSVDGRQLSKEDYNRGVPAYIGVPLNKEKTGYKMVKLEDALNEVKEGKKRSRQQQQFENTNIYGGPTSGAGVLTLLSNAIDSEGKRSEYSGYMNTDPGLVNKLNDLVLTEEQYNKQLETEMLSRLPQVFQLGTVEALNDEAKNMYMNDVVSAAKNVNKGGQFAISLDDIAFIRPPVTGNKGQFGLKPEVAKKLGEEGWMLPDAANKDEMTTIRPGLSFSFNTNRPYMPYDIMFNEAIKKQPYVDNYKGYTIRIAKSKINDETTVQVYDPKGELVDGTSTKGVSDVNALISSMKQFIDTQKK